jgi:hypothetical protein
MTAATAFGQKFMIQGNDTLLYKDKMRILTDTEYYGDKTYYPGDTLYEGSCNTFERVNGQIINQSKGCLRQGLWIITDSLGNYWTGNYHNNHEAGIWKRFDKSGKLLKETEEVSFAKDTYKVKEIDYSSGKPVIVVDRKFLAFYIKNLVAIMIIFFVTFFARPFINSSIYNRENGTDLSLFYFGLPFTKRFWEYAGHGMLCMFTFWFFNFKPENRRLVRISNALSGISLGIFFGIIIGLAINGELH